MLRTLRRFMTMIKVCLYYGLDQAVFPWYLSPSYLLRLYPPIRKIHNQPLGKRLYLSCVDLGPLFIKFGQLVSIRHDLFRKEIIEPLSDLQDKVPPFPSEIAIKTIEKALGSSIQALFLAFNPKPLASASIAQVHEAMLKDKTSVVIKVIRPNIEATLKSDIRLLRILATLIALFKRWPRSTLQKLIDEYVYTLKQELNLTQEGSHYSQMRHLFSHDKRLYVPKVYWEYTEKDVLTLEKIQGIPIDEIQDLSLEDRKTLAHNGIEIFFTQVLEHRFFHADMHPGNVFILPGDPPRYAAVDFGIVGCLSPEDQYYLSENFLAFHHRDYTKIAKLHIEAGWVSPNTPIVPLESAIRHVCEPIFSKNIEDISISDLLSRLIEASKPFELNIQPQFLLLQKTLFYVEALGRNLYPKLNLWEASEPFIERFMKERSSLKTGLKHFKSELPRILAITPKLPYLIHRHLERPPEKPKSPYLYLSIGLIIGLFISRIG